VSDRKREHIPSACDALAHALGGRVQHGATIKGVVETDDLEIAVTMVVTRKVATVDIKRYQREAMTALAANGWQDRCCTTVKNRSTWSVSKTKTCESKVTTAIVYRAHDVVDKKYVQVERFRFCCSHHTEHGPDVIAVVRLPQAELDVLRERRNKENAIRRREEDAKEDRARVESDLGRRLDDADLTIVRSFAELSTNQVAIVRTLIARADDQGLRNYHEAYRYLRMVVPTQSGSCSIDDYIKSLRWRDSPPP
jgi:hypothetical protein